MEQKLVIEAKGLIKRFEDHIALNQVSLEIFRGECFGILGPNNSGKSTLMKTMYGSSSIEEGELFVTGLNARSNIREIKTRIGVVSQDEGFESDFTVRENLKIFSSYHGIDPDVAIHRSEDLLKRMRLEDVGDQEVQHLNLGMKKRLALARAMINHPDLIFMDEPTTGLDSQAREWIWDFLQKLRTESVSLIMTTHYMQEAELLCDRVAMMNQGQILAVGSPASLISEHIGEKVLELHLKPEDFQLAISRLTSLNLQFKVFRNQIHAYLKQGEESPGLLSILRETKYISRPATLSDVFLKLAGYPLRDEPL